MIRPLGSPYGLGAADMRVLLCDDHGVMRDGLRAVLARHRFDVVGDAAEGEEVIALARRLRPDLVIMDISMPGLNGIAATQRLARECPGIKVIALSMHSDQRYVDGMFAAGATGYLVKTSGSEELVRAIHTVACGLEYVSPAVTGTLRRGGWVRKRAARPYSSSPSLGLPGAQALSPRERQVLKLIAAGDSSKGIAERLQIAATTVETHRRQIMEKLNLRTIAELTKYAVREGLSPLE
jgi:two-component system, NarL family, response regulator NreC